MNQNLSIAAIVLDIVRSLAILSIGVGLIAIMSVASQATPQIKTYLNLKKKNDCAMAYRRSFTDEATHTTVQQPIPELYEKCLTE